MVLVSGPHRPWFNGSQLYLLNNVRRWDCLLSTCIFWWTLYTVHGKSQCFPEGSKGFDKSVVKYQSFFQPSHLAHTCSVGQMGWLKNWSHGKDVNEYPKEYYWYLEQLINITFLQIFLIPIVCKTVQTTCTLFYHYNFYAVCEQVTATDNIYPHMKQWVEFLGCCGFHVASVFPYLHFLPLSWNLILLPQNIITDWWIFTLVFKWHVCFHAF